MIHLRFEMNLIWQMIMIQRHRNVKIQIQVVTVLYKT